MERSDKIGRLTAALAMAQGQMLAAKKDSINPHFRSRYADLASVIDAIREPLAAAGIAYTQAVSHDGTQYIVTTIISHRSGQWISSTIPLLLPPSATIQQLGSAITYTRRYALAAILGVAADDDDGDEASRPRPAMVSRPSQPPAVASPDLSAPIVASWTARIEATTTMDELSTVATELHAAKVPEPGATVLRGMYRARQAALRTAENSTPAL
jgi:hypothetical protein